MKNAIVQCLRHLDKIKKKKVINLHSPYYFCIFG